MDRYLGGEDIDLKVLIDDLETAVARGSFYPVLPPRRRTGLGMAELLEVITQALPVAAGARGARRSPAPTASRAAPLDLRPGRPAGRRGGQDHHRPVRRPDLAWSGSSPARCARTRPCTSPGHGLADRGHEDHDVDERVGALTSPLGKTQRTVAAVRRRRHLRGRQARPGRDRRHAVRPRTTRC